MTRQKVEQNAANTSQPITALTGATLLSDDGSYVATLEVGADKKLAGVFVRDVQDGKEVHVKYLASNFTPEETSQVITVLPATATSWECKKAPNGNIVLFWQDTDVFLQIFSSRFEQITVAKKINSYDINYCSNPGHCCFTTDFFSDSSIMVVWRNPISSMRGQYLYSNGEKEGVEFPAGTECSEGIQYLSCPIDLSVQSNDTHMFVWGCGSNDNEQGK